MKNNQNLFFSPEEKGRAFSDVLKEVQEYISSKYSTLMVEGGSEEVKQQVKRYITKYICDYRITVKGKTQEQLIDDLYTEMAEFSFLTKYIFGTGIEEIDINSWRDIEIQYNDGRCEKLEEHFESPEHAVNVIRRMLHVSGMVLDNASPAVLGHLSKNIRIAVLKTPLVDEDVGIAASAEPEKGKLCGWRHRNRGNAGFSGRVPALWNQHLCCRSNQFGKDHACRLAAYHHTGWKAHLYHRKRQP